MFSKKVDRTSERPVSVLPWEIATFGAIGSSEQRNPGAQRAVYRMIVAMSDLRINISAWLATKWRAEIAGRAKTVKH